MRKEILLEINDRVESDTKQLEDVIGKLSSPKLKRHTFLAWFSRYYEVMFLQSYFVNKNIDSAKRYLTICARLNNRSIDIDEYMVRPMPGFLHILLSDDSLELEKLKSWKYALHERHVGSGLMVEGQMPIIHMMLTGRTEEAKKEFEYWKTTDIYKKNEKIFIPFTKYFIGLVSGEKDLIKEGIEMISSEKVQKKLIKYDGLPAELFSLVGMIWTKTAWILGYEVEIDSPYVLMDLMPIKPAEKFEIAYEFLRSST